MSRRPTLALVIAIAGIVIPLSTTDSRTFAPSDSKACLRCHGMPNFGFREKAGAWPRDLSVHADSMASGAHRAIACQSCHADVRTWPHPPSAQRRAVSCADDCHATDSTGSPYTHRAVVTAFASSAHRGGLDGTNRDAPTCLGCHQNDAHSIRPARARVPIAERMAMCETCHDDAARMHRNGVTTEAVASYRRSFHYKAIRFGETNTAVCQDCHTTHGVLPADSTRSSVARGNVATTCGRSDCHPGARMNFAMSGANHLDLRIGRSPILWFEETFFLVLTGGTMAMLLVGIALDIQRRFGWRALLRRWYAATSRWLATGTRATVRAARALLID